MELESDIRLKQFEMLQSLLGNLQKGLMRGTAATAGFLLLGIAWFATEDAAPALTQHPHFTLIAALAPVIGALLYIYVAWLIYRRSQTLVAALRRSDLMPAELYEGGAVSRRQFYTLSGGILLLTMILGACVYLAGTSAAEDNTNQDEVIMQVSLASATLPEGGGEPHPRGQSIQPTLERDRI